MSDDSQGLFVHKDNYYKELEKFYKENQVTIQPPILSDEGQNEDDYDEEEEDDGPVYNESDFKFADLAKRLPHPKIVRACGLALKNFELNSVNTNHCILKLLHRIAFDCKMYVMIFQLSIFRTFQKIFQLKDLPQNKELVKFATYIVRQFVKVSENNKKVFMEALFWKSSKECFDVENGYLETHDKSSAAVRAWREEQEDELRRLFMEHRETNSQEDVVDFVTNNLIDQTKTRRQVLKKLKELMLLVDYKKKSSGSRPPKTWTEEEEHNLRELFEQYKESDDPLGNIIENLDIQRPKNRIVEKLLIMGLIQDKSEIRKKRTRKGGKSGSNHSDESEASNSSDSDVDNALSQKRQKKTGSSKSKKSSGKQRRPKPAPVSKARIAQSLVKIVDSEMQEALEWLKESLSDAIEDYEVENNEGIPLVPIMDYAETAMENDEFQQMLKALGVCPPFDEQEMYWRIPGHLTPDIMQNYCNMIQQALDKTLQIEEELETARDSPSMPENPESSDDEDFFGKLRKITKADSPVVRSRRNDSVDDNEDNTTLLLNNDEDVEQNQDNERSELGKSNDFGNNEVENDQELLESTVDNNMEMEEENNTENISPKKKKKSRIIQESDEESENDLPEKQTINDKIDEETNLSRKGRTILDSDTEDEKEDKTEEKEKRIRSISDSDSEKPVAKRGRILESDDED